MGVRGHRAVTGSTNHGEPHRSGFVGGWRAALATGTLVVGLAACNAPVQPQPPGGGRELDLDYAYFVSHVEPIFEARDCTRTSGCHGGQGAGMMLLSGGSDPHADFITVLPLTRPWDPPSSPLLQKPLAGVEVHGGGDIFADSTDADYRTILAWIAGAKAP
jgi:hypothetical protein